MNIMVTNNGLLYVKGYSKLYEGIYLQDQLSGVSLTQLTLGSVEEYMFYDSNNTKVSSPRVCYKRNFFSWEIGIVKKVVFQVSGEGKNWSYII